MNGHDKSELRFEAYHSRNRVMACGLIGGLLVIFGLWVILDPDWVKNSKYVKQGMDPQIDALILGTLMIWIGAALCHMFRKAITHVGPVVRIDATGILWTAWSAEPIKWSNVDRILVGVDTDTPYFKLYFRDPMISLPDNEKMLVQANADRVSQRAHLYLSFHGLTADRKQLRDVIQWYLKRRSDPEAE
jgi:hypothetical protein